MKFKKILKWAAIILGVLILAAILWAVLPYTVMDEAETALEGNDYVPVTIGDNIYFEPSEINDYNLGLILYPGTRVNSEAYAPLALSLAEKGYFVAIAQMPLDLSVLSIDKASGITKKMLI